jgi:hypothetical protein
MVQEKQIKRGDVITMIFAHQIKKPEDSYKISTQEVICLS